MDNLDSAEFNVEQCSRELLFSTPTLPGLRDVRDRLEREARCMEGSRTGLVMDNYGQMLAARDATQRGVTLVEALEHNLTKLRDQLERIK